MTPPAPPTRRLVIGVVVAALFMALSISEGRGPRDAVAQAPLSQEEQAWITAVANRIDRDSAEEATFAACLQRVIVGAMARTMETRFAAVRRCWVALNSQTTPGELDDGDDAIAGLADTTTGLAELNTLIDQRTQQLLTALAAWGATPEQVEEVRGRLQACMAAWGLVAGVEFVGSDEVKLNEEAVGWCAADLPDFDKLRKTAPLIKSVGCPARVAQGRSFSCAAVIEGDATTYSWQIGGSGSGSETRSPQFTTTIDIAGPTTVELLVCNGEPEASATNCVVSTQSITVGPPLPAVSSPGCPSTTAVGRPITCTPTGVSNTTTATLWGWSSSGQIANDGAPVATITFAMAGAQSVSLVICNDRETCSDPVSQTVFVDTPALQVSVTTDKSTYRVGDSITICWTVPGPGTVRLVDLTPDGGRTTVRESGGTGNGCITGTVSPPTGRECVRIEYSNATGTASAQACFTVEAAASASPSPSPRPTASPAPSSPPTPSYSLGGIYRGSFSAPLSVAGGIQRFQIDVSRGSSATTVTKNTVQVTLRSNGTVLDATVELDIARTEGSVRLTGTYRGTLEAQSQVIIEGANGVPELILGTFQVRGTVATFTNGQPNRSQSETIRFYYTTALTNGIGGNFNGTLLICLSDQRTRDSCRSLPVAMLRQ